MLKALFTMTLILMVVVGFVAMFPQVWDVADAVVEDHYGQQNVVVAQTLNNTQAQIAALTPYTDADAMFDRWYAQQLRELDERRTQAWVGTALAFLAFVIPVTLLGFYFAVRIDNRLENDRQNIRSKIETYKKLNKHMREQIAERDNRDQRSNQVDRAASGGEVRPPQSLFGRHNSRRHYPRGGRW
jgi:hypothetical protein